MSVLIPSMVVIFIFWQSTLFLSNQTTLLRIQSFLLIFKWLLQLMLIQVQAGLKLCQWVLDEGHILDYGFLLKNCFLRRYFSWIEW